MKVHKDENEVILVEEKFIREEEKDIIVFSINGLIKFIEKITNEDMYQWILICDKNNLTIHYQNGVIIIINVIVYFVENTITRENSL